MVYEFTTAGVLLCMQVVGFLVAASLVLLFGIRMILGTGAVKNDGELLPDVDNCVSACGFLLLYVVALTILQLVPATCGPTQPQVAPPPPAIIAVPVEPAKIPPVRRPQQHAPAA